MVDFVSAFLKKDGETERDTFRGGCVGEDRQRMDFMHTHEHTFTWMPSSSLLMHQKLSASMFLRASS